MDLNLIKKNLSDSVKYHLEVSDQTVKDFADDCEVSPFVIRKIVEMDDGKLNIDDVVKICNFLDVPLGALAEEGQSEDYASNVRCFKIVSDVREAFKKAHDRAGLDKLYDLFHAYYENALVDQYDYRLDEIEPIEDLCIGPALDLDELIGLDELISESV